MAGKSIAIIPARGGSKRIPRKNIKEFNGYPIIKYSIDAAFNSGSFDTVMVSTDDEEIAAVSKEYGASVPFFRSPKTANDFAGIADVVDEVLDEFGARGEQFDYACIILATAPFIDGSMIAESCRLLKENDADAVVPVTRFEYPIQRALVTENGWLSMMWPENYQKRSQDFSPAFHDSGLFYWIKVSSFLKQKVVFMKKAFALELSLLQVHDIDTEEDWNIAELKHRIIQRMKPA